MNKKKRNNTMRWTWSTANTGTMWYNLPPGASNSITIGIEFCHCKKPEVQWKESDKNVELLLRHHTTRIHLVPWCTKCGLRVSYERLEELQ